MKLLLILFAAAAAAQDFSQRGFLESAGLFFPQTAPGDSSHAAGEWLLRYEPSYKLAPSLRIYGSFDARTDTHLETERDPHISWWDRERRRPAFAVRRLSATWSHGRLTVEGGKQFVRWGKTDILNPTDRFAPRDYLNVVDNDFLGITAARVTYGTQSDTIDVVFEPRLTPSRVPLLNQRWAVLPVNIPISEIPPAFAGGSNVGARWNHIGAGIEYALAFYNGHDHLPLFDTRIALDPFRAEAQRFYPQLRMYGGDAALPLKFVTVKAEAGYFTSTDARSDEYGLWVLQLERQAGEWSFIGGYAGEFVTRRGASLEYSPSRGFARSFVGHAGYTIDTNRSVALETIVRQNGEGIYIKPEYTQAIGQNWRITAGFAVIRGAPSDFLGQYRRNSHAILSVRYSF